MLVIAPAFGYLDIHLYGNPVGMLGTKAGIYHLVHTGDHDLLDEPGHLRGLVFGALDA